MDGYSVLCLLLAGALLAGTVLFVGRFLVNGSSWASFLPVFSGQPATGRVLDRDGDVLTWVDEDGKRRYYDGATVREATLHAVGDAQGRIGTGGQDRSIKQILYRDLLIQQESHYTAIIDEAVVGDRQVNGHRILEIRLTFQMLGGHQDRQHLGHGSGVNGSLRLLFRQDLLVFHINEDRIFAVDLCSQLDSIRAARSGVDHRLGLGQRIYLRVRQHGLHRHGRVSGILLDVSGLGVTAAVPHASPDQKP